VSLLTYIGVNPHYNLKETKMGHIKFTTEYKGMKVIINGSWDHILEYYRLNIYDFNPLNNQSPMWTALNYIIIDELRTTDVLKSTIEEMCIVIPDGFWEQLERKENELIITFINGRWKEKVERKEEPCPRTSVLIN